MRLHYLRTRGLKGLFAFPQGLEFAFDKLPAGLVAIVGPNGEGKTSFLEAPLVALFGEFPSRPDCALIDGVDGRDATLELHFDIEGRGLYRAFVNVDGVKRTTDALLERIPSGSAPLSRSDVRLNDGKISTYRAAVARELPSKELLLASAFAAQNRAGSFATLDRKGRRELFSQLLGLERYERMAATAREAAAFVSSRLTWRRGLLADLQRATAPAMHEQLEQTGDALRAELAEALRAKEGFVNCQTALEQRLETLRAGAARHAAAHAAMAQLEMRLAENLALGQRLEQERARLAEDERRDLAAINSRRDQAIAGLRASIDAIQTVAQLDAALERELVAHDTQTDREIAERETRIENNAAVLARAPEIYASVDEATFLRRTVVGLELAHSDQQRELELKRTAQQAADRAQFDAVAEAARIEADAHAARLLQTVPCHAAGECADCEFLVDARAAQLRVASAADPERLIAAADARLASARADLNHAASAREHTRAQLDDARSQLQAIESTAALLPKLEAATARVAELREDQARIRANAERRREQLRANRDEAVRVNDELRADRERVIELAHAEAVQQREAMTATYRTRAEAIAEHLVEVIEAKASVRAELEAQDQIRARTVGAAVELEDETAELARTRRALEEATHRLGTLQEQVADVERRRATLVEQCAERDEVTEHVRELETQLVEWTALAKIFGREGLPVLEIDAAGPGVSALANDLLQACFGSRFTLELITQDMKVDGSGFKEVFDVTVYDADRGGEARRLQLLSGGEQVIVDEALKSAIALHLNQRHDQPIRTCWRDETTGALDPDNALRYVQMLRRLRDAGGFHQVFFVTHNLEAAALADVQLVIGGGRVQVLYPPFTPSEAA
jgi:exonuclease SbcC